MDFFSMFAFSFMQRQGLFPYQFQKLLQRDVLYLPVYIVAMGVHGYDRRKPLHLKKPHRFCGAELVHLPDPMVWK